jgi:DNA polymerase-3 subunit delta
LPIASAAEVRKQIAGGRVAPIYLIVGPDETAKVALASEFLDLSDEGLRAFNVDRLYGGEATGATIVDAARTLPMMVPTRLVLVMHAERLLNPKRESDATARDLEQFEDYVKAPADTCCMVLVADTVDKRRSLTRQLLSRAVVVECSGPSDVSEAASWVKSRVAQEKMTIDARAARLVAERVGPDISRLRSDVERLVLYAAGNAAITEADVREVVAEGSTTDDWAMTRAIERGAAAEALRELGSLLENGAVPYVILGQLAWFARAKVPSPRVASAVGAVFRTDLAIKTSAGDPRILLERLVVELCAK